MRRNMEDMPVLLMKVFATPESMPVDVRFCSTLPEDGEFVYPPGAYFEQRREFKDTLGEFVSDDGEEVLCTTLEVLPHIARASGMGKGKKLAAAAPGAPGGMGATT